MEDETVLIIVSILGGIFIGSVVGSFTTVNEQVSPMGNMICSERGHGDFVKFADGDVYCEEKEQLEPYDGGYIIVQKK